MRKWLFTGSFDPVTYGHFDLIHIAARLCDKLYVGVGTNASKKYWFTMEERLEMLKETFADSRQDIEFIAVPGLTIDKAAELGCNALVRGIRDASDVDREIQILNINKDLERTTAIETVFLHSGYYSHVSSSAARELALLGASLEQLQQLVPYKVALQLLERASRKQKDQICIDTGAMGTVTPIYHPEQCK